MMPAAVLRVMLKHDHAAEPATRATAGRPQGPPPGMQGPPQGGYAPGGPQGRPPGSPQGQPPGSAPGPAKRKRAVSTGQILGGILLVLVVIFIFENTAKVKVRLIVPQYRMPVALPIVIAAVLGALIAWLLRYRRQRHHSSQPKGRQHAAARPLNRPYPGPVSEQPATADEVRAVAARAREAAAELAPLVPRAEGRCLCWRWRMRSRTPARSVVAANGADLEAGRAAGPLRRAAGPAARGSRAGDRDGAGTARHRRASRPGRRGRARATCSRTASRSARSACPSASSR